MELNIKMTGTKAMLMHNVRMANPIDSYVQALKELTGKRKKTEEDLIKIMMIEAEGGLYWNEDDIVAMPTKWLWKSIHESCKTDKLGKEFQKAVMFSDVEEPIVIRGESTVTKDEFLTHSNWIDYRSVKVGTSRLMRARPFFGEGWECTHRLELLTDVMDKATLLPIIDRAGRLFGVGDYRPIYGTYAVEIA